MFLDPFSMDILEDINFNNTLNHANHTLEQNSLNILSISEPNTSDWPLIAGLFAIFAIVLSLYEIYRHLQNFKNPYIKIQKCTIRILFMVPIYSLNSWLAMYYPGISIYMDTMRECYEAFVIYNFKKYLFYFMDDFINNINEVIESKPSPPNNFPFCMLPPLPGGRRFIDLSRHAMIQYVVIRPSTTIFAFILQIFGVYGEGELSLKYGYIYLLIINNFSQMIAMYFLVMFYQNYKYELAPMKPLGKFLSIKAVIFFSFFQGVILTILIHFGIITRSLIPGYMPNMTNYEMSKNLQDFLICFEMLLAAIAHMYVFSHRQFANEASSGPVPITYSFNRVVDLTDERTDVVDHIRYIGRRFKNFWDTGNENETRPMIPLQVRMPGLAKNPKGYQSI